jgi:RHS repeat-associated protein
MRRRVAVLFLLVLMGVTVGGSRSSSSARPVTVPASALTPALLDQAERGASDQRAKLEAAQRWRATSGAKSMRRQSRTAFGELDAKGSARLASDTFGLELEGVSAVPEVVPDGWDVIRSINETDVVIASPAGEHRIVDSELPVTAIDEKGHREQVDLTLERADGGWVPQNAASEIRLPDRLDEGIDVGRIRVEVPAAGTVDGVQVPGSQAVLYPDAVAGADADFVVAPTLSGIETYVIVRSPAAAESSDLKLTIPAGAALISDAKTGAINVVKAGAVVASVLPPQGVDAQGAPVDVSMKVDGDRVTLIYPHREKDLAYPLSIDPPIVDSAVDGTISWYSYHSSPAFAELTYCDPFGHVGGSCPDAVIGLWIYRDSRSQAGRTWGQWQYEVPYAVGKTTTTARIASFQVSNVYGNAFGWSGQSPTIVTGIVNQPSGAWAGGNQYASWALLNQVGPVSASFNATNADAKVAVFALDHPAAGTRGDGSYGYFGAATVSVVDPEGATVTQVAEAPWIGVGSHHSMSATATDPGTGVVSWTLYETAFGAGNEYQAYTPLPMCQGKRVSQCPSPATLPSGAMELNAANAYPGHSSLAPGVHQMSLCAWDAAWNAPSACAPFKLKIDTTPPEIDGVGGTLKSVIDSGGLLGQSSYSLTVDAHDGSGSGASATRSGVRYVRYLVDGVQVMSHPTPGCTATQCPTAPPDDTFTYVTGSYNTPSHPGPTHTVQFVVGDAVAGTPNEQASPVYTVTEYQPPSAVPVGIGFEDWWTYEKHATGAGGSYHVNLTNGNGIWTNTPVSNPGRGLSSFVRFTYNAQEDNTAVGAIYSQAGAQFSVQGSGLTRLNEPLDLTLAASGSSPRQLVLRDGDGTQHIFANTTSGGDGGWVAPAGVHLQLRKITGGWLFPRADGVTYRYDDGGWPTTVTDRNGNALTFEYEAWSGGTPQCGVAPNGCTQRVKRIRDAAGRYVTFTYGTAGPEAARITQITDHAGIITRLNYVAQGTIPVLESIVEASGTADARGTHFTYQANGDRPRLSEVDDPRTDNAGKTTIAYAGTAPNSKVQSVSDRRSHVVTYDYSTASCDDGGGSQTYTRALATDAKSHATSYFTDGTGRLHCQTSPRGFLSTQRWTGQNNVGQRVEASGTPEAATSTWEWSETGDDHEATLTSFTDPEENKTSYTYQRGNGGSAYAVDAGRTFVQDVKTIVSPRGNASGATAADFTTTFEYDAAGNLTSKESPGNEDQPFYTAAYTYDGSGNLLTAEDESHHTTSYRCYDGNGDPGVKLDQRGHAWRYERDVVGNLVAVTDPRRAQDATAGGTDCSSVRPTRFTQTTTYDRLNRKLTQRTPKDTEDVSVPIVVVDRSWQYDANDNEKAEVDGNGAQWTREFSNTDQVSKLTSPTVAHHDEGAPAAEVTTYSYDEADNLECERRPLNTKGDAGHTTCYAYDADDHKTAEIQRAASSDDSASNLYTTYSYDRRGNVTGIADPKANDTAASVAAVVARASTDATRRFAYEYDKADRRIIQIEDPSGLKLRTRWFYDEDDNVVRVAHPRAFDTDDDGVGDTATARPGYSDTYGFDRRDLLISQTDALDRATTIERRGDGKPSKITSPRGQGTTADPDDFASKLTYWDTGELKSRTLPRKSGQYGPEWKVEYDVDVVGDPTTITDARGHAFENAFYDTGELKRTDRPSWWVYDADGEGGPVIRERTSSDPAISDAAESGIPTAKGAVGNLGAVTGQPIPDVMPRAARTEIFYDQEMRPNVVTNGPGTALEPDDADRLRYSQNLTYDAVGRLTKRTTPLDGLDRVVLNSTYDRDGNLTTSTDGKPTNVTTHTYDAFDRRATTTAPGAQGGDRTTTFDLDANGNVELEHTPISGQNIDPDYDAADRLISQRAPIETSPIATTTFRYDADGNVTRRTDPRANVADHGSSDYAQDQFTQYFHDAAGQLTKTRVPETDEYSAGADRDWDYEYDADGNQTLVTSPGSRSSASDMSTNRRSVRSGYDGRGLLWTQTTADGDVAERTAVTEYDGNGNLRRTVDPAGVDQDTKEPLTSFPSIDSDADLSTTTELNHYATVRSYADDNLLSTIDLPWGTGDGAAGDSNRKRWRQTFAYAIPGDANRPNRGWVRKIRSPYNAADLSAPTNEQRYEYYDNGWIKESRDADLVGGTVNYSQIIGYDYDENGLQTDWSSRLDPDDPGAISRRIHREYWPSKELKERTATRYVNGSVDDRRSYSYRYDKRGSLTKFTDHQPPRGNTTSPTAAECIVVAQPTGCPERNTNVIYDGSQRPLEVNEAWTGGKDTRYRYLPDGRIRRIEADGTIVSTGDGYDDGKTSSYTYDERGNSLATDITQAGSSTRSTTEEYWPSDQPKSIDRVNGSTQSTYYAADGKPTQRVNGSASTNYTYTDANRNRTHDERGNYTYNARRQVATWNRGASATRPARDVSYTLNGAGAVTKNVDHYDENIGLGLAETTITTTNTLRGDRLESALVEATGQADKTIDYEYDTLFGSLTSVDDGDEVTRYKYDAFERLARTWSTESSSTGDQIICSDGLDRRDRRIQLPAHSGSDFAGGYDERAACGKTPSGATAYDYGYVGTTEALSRESVPSKVRFYDYDGAGGRLGQASADNDAATKTFHPYETDVNRNVVAVLPTTNTTPSADDKYDFDPYGELERQDFRSGHPASAEDQLSGQAQDNPFRYEGFYYDASVRTYDMQARDYRPDIGRFLTQDRFEDAGTDVALQGDPLTNNRYVFSGGNPVGSVEYDGHTPGMGAGCIPRCGDNAGNNLQPAGNNPNVSAPAGSPAAQRPLSNPAAPIAVGNSLAAAATAGIVAAVRALTPVHDSGSPLSWAGQLATGAYDAGVGQIKSGIGALGGAVGNPVGTALGIGGRLIPSPLQLYFGAKDIYGMTTGLYNGVSAAYQKGGVFGAAGSLAPLTLEAILLKRVGPTGEMGVAGESTRLRGRADELHGVLDARAQRGRTSAVLSTQERRDVLAGGVRDLDPAQRGLAGSNDILGKMPGAHAEETALNAAVRAGLNPRAIKTTTNICPACRALLEGSGATITGPRSAWWFR